MSKNRSRILWAVDADTFASIVLINRHWYSLAQNLELYAHHLSRCPAYALTNTVITGPFRTNDFKRIKARFAVEVRRNLFEAYLRPHETLINIISLHADSSTAFPGGEAFRFSFSPNGQTVLALSSSRIFVIDLTTDIIAVRRELKTVRRPIAASITDDGSLLAVLSTKHQANIYGLTPNGVEHIQVLVLNNPPRTIALTHEGTVLAAAYEGGVEVFSLAANALSTDRRAVRCEAVDALTFSGDGSMLVGSSHGPEDPCAVVISAPFYTENDPNLSDRDIHSRMWTTQILFPNNSSTCSHVTLLPGHSEGDGNWLFAFDHMLQSFRAARTDDTRTGVTYFLSPTPSRRFSIPIPSIGPTAASAGDLVVAGFCGSGLWVYGIPERVDTAPDMGAVIERHERHCHGRVPLTSVTGNRDPLLAYSPSVSGTSDPVDDDSLAGKVDWRQSIFVKGRHLKSISGISAAQWVEKLDGLQAGFPGKRLAVVAPGGVSSFAEELGDEPIPVDGGRIMLLDFDYTPREGGSRAVTIEVGDKEPELLPEQRDNLDVEVALERSRTIRATGGRGTRRLSLGRSATAIGAHRAEYETDIDERVARNGLSQPPSPAGDPSPPGHGSCSRPGDQLQSATTATALTRAIFPPRPPLASAQGVESGQGIYTSVNGISQIPHESDADNWEPPPPPYKRSPTTSDPDPRATLPRHATAPAERITEVVLPPHRANTTLDGMTTSEHAPSTRVISQYAGLARPTRSRGMNETSLDDLAETSYHRQFSDRTQYLYRLDSNSSFNRIFSDESSSHSSPLGCRPVSYDGRVRSGSYFSLHPTISRPLSNVPGDDPDLCAASPEPSLPLERRPSSSPISPNDGSIAQYMALAVPPPPEMLVDTSHKPSAASSGITATGSDPQTRLNRPVPPTSSQVTEHATPIYTLPLQVGRTPPPNLLPTKRAEEPYAITPLMPTREQVENLAGQVSGGEERMIPSGEYYPLPGAPGSSMAVSASTQAQLPGNVVAPPSPPRAVWGAAGLPRRVPFTKARSSVVGLLRTGSVKRNDVVPGGGLDSPTPRQGLSHAHLHAQSFTLGSGEGNRSSPDLLASTRSQVPPEQQMQWRPQFGRLDTIESVTSSAQCGLSRAQSVAYPASPLHPRQRLAPAPSPMQFDERIQVGTQIYAHSPPQRGGAADISKTAFKKAKRERRRAEKAEKAATRNKAAVAASSGNREGGGKCVVM